MFNVRVLNPKHTLYEGKAWSVSLPGEHGALEILDYHTPISTLLKQGEIVIDWKIYLPIEKGLAKFYNNELVALVEE
jgi:F0F1-type ATP synthase epsilon subunit